MANFDVKPQFDVVANMMQPTDPGHADLFNSHFGRLYNNDEYLKERVETAENIAKGRNRAHVFKTTEGMQAFLSNEENKGLYNVGDNIYIVEVEVPDWWISEVLEDIDAETGYYYKIAQLETQKVDLTNIESDINDLQDNVNEINSNLNGIVIVKEFTGTVSTMKANQQYSAMVNYTTPSGYKMLSVCYYNTPSEKKGLNATGFRKMSSTMIGVEVENTTATDYSNVTVTLGILFIRDL